MYPPSLTSLPFVFTSYTPSFAKLSSGRRERERELASATKTEAMNELLAGLIYVLLKDKEREGGDRFGRLPVT